MHLQTYRCIKVRILVNGCFQRENALVTTVKQARSREKKFKISVMNTPFIELQVNFDGTQYIKITDHNHAPNPDEIIAMEFKSKII